MKSKVGGIFKERPEQWGLRGDPYLWGDLENYFSNNTTTFTEGELESEIKKTIETVTGQNIESNRFIYVERYNHGGMSGGAICQEFWLEKAIPLLLSRFRLMCQ